jgi:hypothetical protein
VFRDLGRNLPRPVDSGDGAVTMNEILATDIRMRAPLETEDHDTGYGDAQ